MVDANLAQLTLCFVSTVSDEYLLHVRNTWVHVLKWVSMGVQSLFTVNFEAISFFTVIFKANPCSLVIIWPNSCSLLTQLAHP